jgi:glycosyltransferase involved in cell wall biosynthesis
MVRAIGATLRIGWRSDRGLLRTIAYLAEACVLLDWLRSDGVEHVHAHFGTNSAAVAMLCRTLGGPTYSFTVHGPEEFDKPEALHLGEKVREASFAVVISEFGRSQLCRWVRFEDWSKIHVVHCGLEADLLGAEPTPVPEFPRLLCIARLAKEKGHMVLLDAAERLAAEGKQFEILLAGDGPLRAEIEKRIGERGLGSRVRIGGWMSAAEIRDAIVRSRVLVLSSFAEGLPVVIMESLALGRPVIATAIAGIPELVTSGANGWLVPAGSVDALADAMRVALNASTHDIRAMGIAGSKRVVAEHDARAEAEKLVRCFRDVARSG